MSTGLRLGMRATRVRLQPRHCSLLKPIEHCTRSIHCTQLSPTKQQHSQNGRLFGSIGIKFNPQIPFHPFTHLKQSTTSRDMATSATTDVEVTPINTSDYSDWERLFRLYIEFYKSSIPNEQYRKTFDRIINPDTDLYALGLRSDGKLRGIAHFFPHQTPWSQGQIMHFNDLFIDPDLRGNGYGRQMIQAVAKQAKDMGCIRLQWATQHGNPARKLYDELAACDFVEYRMKLP